MMTTTLGKNFRLPTTIKPRSYDADLRLDMEAGRFDGVLTIAVQLAAAAPAITVHAVGLEVSATGATVGGSDVPATASADAESETVTLAFARPLPAGEASLRIGYRGAFSPGLRGLYRAGSL